MAFNPDHLGLQLQSIGNGLCRIFGYDGTTEAPEAVLVLDYIQNAANIGMQIGDVVMVRFTTGEPVIYYVSSISDAGHGSLSLFPSDFLVADRTIYVATTGNDNADGNSISTPVLTAARAFEIASDLNLWGSHTLTIQFAAGTYSGASNAGLTYYGIRSRNPIVITGPTVAYPGVPTVFIEGADWEFNDGMDLDFRYLKFQNRTGAGAVTLVNRVKAVFTNVHVFNCLNGISYSTHCAVSFTSGIIDCNNLANSIGIKDIFLNYHNIGTQGGAPLTVGPLIKNCITGMLIQESGTGHVNAAFEDCTFGIDTRSRGRANYDLSNFKRCSIGVRATSNSDIFSTAAVFNDATADECAQDVMLSTGAIDLTDTVYTVGWTSERYIAVAETVSGTAAEQFITSFAWSKRRFSVPSSINPGRSIRFTASGEKTGTAGAYDIRIRLHTIETANGDIAAGASQTATDAGRWYFEGTVDLVDENAQEGFSKLSHDGVATQLGRHSITTDLHDGVDRFWNLTVQMDSASDSMTIDKFQVETLG